MEDRYMTPGNQERGWNDPPQFSYGLQKAPGPHRNLLNRRAAPAASGTGTPPMTPPTCDPLAPPPRGVAPPPPPAGRPPPAAKATPPPPDSSQSQSEPEVEAVMGVLSRALGACRQVVKDQVCNDVDKRLRLLEDSWRTGRLSLPVRRRMDHLSQELQSGRWDSADELHRSLMVDHVTEVSQWMVGVKRLIAETRKLSPELLGPLLRPVVQDPPEPVQDPPEPVQDPPAPALDPVEPVLDPVDPVLDSVDRVQDPVDPVLDSVDRAQDPVEPIQDPVCQS